MIPLSQLALRHLALRLRPINRALRAATARQTQLAARLLRPDITPLCITEDQVGVLLDDVDALLSDNSQDTAPEALTAEEFEEEEMLRTEAAAQQAVLPLDRLAQALELSNFELEAILLCAAPEIDRSYERVYAYVLDDLNRRQPCIELLSMLTADSFAERLERRHILGEFGKLRRIGLLRRIGEAATELRQELQVVPGLVDFLAGHCQEPPCVLCDPADIVLPPPGELPFGADSKRIERLGRALAQRRMTVVGVWGQRLSDIDGTAKAIAAASGMGLRQYIPNAASETNDTVALAHALQTAAALGAVLWIDVDQLQEPFTANVAHALANSGVPLLLTGNRPWRPLALLETRDFAEITLLQPDHAARRALWFQTLPEAEPEQLEDIATRYQMAPREVRAAARVARSSARLAGNGHAAEIGDHIEAACGQVTRRLSTRFATVIDARRGPQDLILPATLHRQVLEIAGFFRAWPKASVTWKLDQFGRGGGIKALLTGDSGTGKTLAAEVIAKELGLPLLKVDLAQVVSKWVGETEKQLEAAFREAEDSQAVLFFDEADALFGKRGEVQHGVDRYANLEVSYLLQRLEEYSGIVVLASNLKDNIDSAFTRRFHVVLHFPRPEAAERRRIWEIALPPGTPREEDVDLEVLAQLDLTGAGIVNAARTAALMAASSNSPIITKTSLVQAIARQYRREARVLSASELGSYAVHLREAR